MLPRSRLGESALCGKDPAGPRHRSGDGSDQCIPDRTAPSGKRIAGVADQQFRADDEGLATGALGSSLLVQYAPAPLRFVYWILLALCILGIALTLGMREPGQRRDGASHLTQTECRCTRGRPSNLHSGCAMPHRLLGTGWLLPGTRAVRRGHHGSFDERGRRRFPSSSCSRVSARSALCLLRKSSPAVAEMAGGCLLLAVGVRGAPSGLSRRIASTGLFLGTAVSGVGFGLGFLGVFRMLSALAPPEGRAAMITAIYIVSYLAFSLPVIAAGIAATPLA